MIEDQNLETLAKFSLPTTRTRGGMSNEFYTLNFNSRNAVLSS